MSGQNDLAIVMAKKIHAAVVELATNTATKHSNASTIAYPNFYSLREEILKVLNEYMEELHISHTQDKHFDRQIPIEYQESIANQQLKAQAHYVVEELMKKEDYFLKIKYDDPWKPYETTIRTIAVLKTGKLFKETK